MLSFRLRRTDFGTRPYLHEKIEIMYSKTLLKMVVVITGLIMTDCTKERFIDQSGFLVPKTVDEESSLPSISVNGTKLHAEAFGNPSNPMLVVLHGGPGADYRYLLNCKTFAENGFYVIFYDQRGSGLSQRHQKSSYYLDIMVDDLREVINHYTVSASQKVFLLGHSWGGMLATDYINSYPNQITGAIIAEPGGLIWDDIKNYITRSHEYKITGEALNDAVYQEQFISGKENQHAILDYKFALLASAEEKSDSPLGNEGFIPFWRQGAVVNKAMFELADKNGIDLISNLNKYQTKILFVYSERNKAYGLEHAKKVSAAFPQAELFRVDGAGHDMLTFTTGFQNFYPKALSYLNSLK